MALPQYNTEILIENIKRRCSVPTSQLTYTPQSMTDIANDELQTEVVPLIMSTREEYFVEHIDVLSPSDGIIPFPENAVGAKLRSVCYMQQTSPITLINLPRIDLDVVAGVGFINYDTLAGFYIEGNNLCLYPNTSVPTNTNIRLYYYKRVLNLAAPAQYGQIMSIDSMLNTIVLDFVPTTWAVGNTLNSVSSVQNFKVTQSSAEIVTLSAPSLILDTVDGMSVGDYVSLEGYSAIPQVPIEAHAYLAQLSAVKLLEGLGDRPGMEAAQAKADREMQKLMVMISQRVDGSIKKIMHPSGGLRISGGLGRGYGWY